MLTRQLQELWRKSRGSLVPQRLLFEVTSANVVSEHGSKYVVSEGGGLGGGQSREAGGGWRSSPAQPTALGGSGLQLREEVRPAGMGLRTTRVLFPPGASCLMGRGVWWVLPLILLFLPFCCDWGTAGPEEPQVMCTRGRFLFTCLGGTHAGSVCVLCVSALQEGSGHWWVPPLPSLMRASLV